MSYSTKYHCNPLAPARRVRQPSKQTSNLLHRCLIPLSRQRMYSSDFNTLGDRWLIVSQSSLYQTGTVQHNILNTGIAKHRLLFVSREHYLPQQDALHPSNDAVSASTNQSYPLTPKHAVDGSLKMPSCTSTALFLESSTPHLLDAINKILLTRSKDPSTTSHAQQPSTPFPNQFIN